VLTVWELLIEFVQNLMLVNCKEKFPKSFEFLFTFEVGQSFWQGAQMGLWGFPFPHFTFFLHFYHSEVIFFMSFTGWMSITSSPYHTGLAKFVSYISTILPTRWILVSYVFMKIVSLQLLSLLLTQDFQLMLLYVELKTEGWFDLLITPACSCRYRA
jgi:hypothetical protein